LYHNGSAGQAKKLGAKERKVKTRSLKTEGCGTPRVSAPPAKNPGRQRHAHDLRVSATGKQYLVIAAGGHPKITEEKLGDSLSAFALP